MSGCKKIRYDWGKDCEVCCVTGKATGVSMMCDFDYDECPINLCAVSQAQEKHEEQAYSRAFRRT